MVGQVISFMLGHRVCQLLALKQQKLKSDIVKFLSSYFGNWDIDFFNFHHHQVKKFEISNQFKRDWNFVVNSQKHQKWNRKLMNDYVIFCKYDLEYSLNIYWILLTYINVIKIGQKLDKFCAVIFQNLAVKNKRIFEQKLLD